MTEHVLGVVPRQIEVGLSIFRVMYRPGKTSQPPLLLLNGFGASAEIFQPLVDKLDPDLSFICLDPPGIGGSPRPALPYRLSGYAKRIGQVLNTLGVQQVDFLGISWGGAIAQQFAKQNPRRCRRLVLVSTGPAPIMKPSLSTLREVIWPKRFHPVNGRQIAANLYGGKVKKDPALLDIMKREIPNSGGECYQQYAILGWTSLPFLPFMKQPALVMSGEHDGMVPGINSTLIDWLMPNAKHHIFDDGHVGLLTSADELSPIIQSFLATH